MRDQLGLSSERAKEIMHTISGFAQMMFLFRNNSGLAHDSAIPLVLADLPTYEFADLEFDALKPFYSVGFYYVEHPGPFLLSRGNASEPSDSRKPKFLFSEDHRCKLINSSKIFYCDICGKAVKHNGGGGHRNYEGAFVNKTWNTKEQVQDPNYRKVTRETLYQGYLAGEYDLTWYCLQCHAKKLRMTNLREVAHKLGLWDFAEAREKHKQVRKRKGYFR